MATVYKAIDTKLKRQILSDGPLPIELALKYARQLAAGLAAAHERGVIQRDINTAT